MLDGVLRWVADCMTVKSDINSKVQPVKPDRLKFSKRIDGVVTAIMGTGHAMVDDNTQSAYAERRLSEGFFIELYPAPRSRSPKSQQLQSWFSSKRQSAPSR